MRPPGPLPVFIPLNVRFCRVKRSYQLLRSSLLYWRTYGGSDLHLQTVHNTTSL